MMNSKSIIYTFTSFINSIQIKQKALTTVFICYLDNIKLVNALFYQ